MSFPKITTAGAGTMGSQVAWQMAFHGKHVIVYDAIPAGLAEGQGVASGVRRALHRAARRHPEASRRHLRTPDIHDRPGGCGARCRSDQRVRARVMSIKESFWREASKHAPAKTVFTTNTSTLMPSALVGFVDRPQKFLALHFAIGVWDSNIGSDTQSQLIAPRSNTGDSAARSCRWSATSQVLRSAAGMKGAGDSCPC